MGLLSIHIVPAAGAPMQSVPHAIAIAGLGLEGDRYATGRGQYSTWPGDHEITLIEAETIDRIAVEHGLTLGLGETRRNLVTREVTLNELIGRRFRIGEVICLGTRPCYPCAYLERLTAHPGLTRMLAESGGIHAQILSGGVIFEGDEVVVLP